MRRILVPLVLLCGCGKAVPPAADVFEQADTVTLYSLDGNKDRGAAADNRFHGFEILGRVELTAEQRGRVAAYLRQAGGQKGDKPAACFWPRHALRAEKGGAVVTDLLICLQCRNVEYRPAGGAEMPVPPLRFADKPLFNDVLTAAGIPLCPEF